MQRVFWFAWLNVVVVAMCAAALFTARPALAVNDCSDPGYAAAIDSRVGAGGCVEITRIPIRHRGGVSWLRVLRTTDLPMDARSNDVIGWLHQVAERVGASMDEMGLVDTDDVSILMNPYAADSTGDVDTQATARWPNPHYPGQCLVSMNLGAFGADLSAEALQFTMAHELFHCIQFKTWNYGPTTSGIYWWAEGSAEWFAALAFPEFDGARGSIEDFDANSSTQSLLSMRNEDVVFFSWSDTRAGPSGVKYALDVLASARSVSDVPSSVERAFGGENLQTFGQDYLDGVINLPHGRALNASPRVPTQSWDAPLHLEGRPFVVVRGQINYDPGEYRNRIEAAHGRYNASHQRRHWEALPGSFDLNCNDDKEYTFTAFATSNPGVDITVTPQQLLERTCTPCGAAETARRAHQACVVGTWTFPGYQSFCSTFSTRLGARGASVLECSPGTGEVTFNADGTVTSRATGENVRVRMSNGTVMHIVHELTEGQANWSTDHGEIEFCDARTTMTGTTTVTASNGSSRVAPINEATPPTSGGASYVCTPTTLTITTHDAPGAFLGAGPEMVLQRRH